MASSIRATSVTFRAIGPETLMSLNRPRYFEWPRGQRPGLGRNPTTELKAPGMRKEPPKSLPVASQHCPVARLTAAPPDDPPAFMRVSHGLRVAPKTSLKVLAPAPNSGVLDLPMTMAPLASRVLTIKSDSVEIRSL